MRPVDLLGMTLAAFGRQKARVALTVIGVAIGAYALISSLSVGRGVEGAILDLARRNDGLRRLEVYQGYDRKSEAPPAGAIEPVGTMDEAKRARLRAALRARWDEEHFVTSIPTLTAAKVDEIAAMPGVVSAWPEIVFPGRAELDGKETPAEIRGVDPESASIAARLVAGRGLVWAPGRSALIQEATLYKMGLTDGAAIGRPIRVEFRSEPRGRSGSIARSLGSGFGLGESEGARLEALLKSLAPTIAAAPLSESDRGLLRKMIAGLTRSVPEDDRGTFAETFTIVGVVRAWEAGDDPKGSRQASAFAQRGDVLLPRAEARDFWFRDRRAAGGGFSNVRIVVAREDDVAPTEAAIEAKGFRVFSVARFIATLRSNVTLITFASSFIAVVALAVAAIGIVNVMTMSVLERTREIGVMKAIGATDGQVARLFLAEGAAIGLAGGLLGLLLAWLASYPGDMVARSIMAKQANETIERSLFAFPASIVVGIPLATTMATILATLIPARRAARLDPIAAIRHE